MTEKRIKQKILNWTLIGTILLVSVSCSLNKKYTGCYKDTSIKGAYCYSTITLNKDSTAVYTWWTDIIMINEGSWSNTNDTIVFIDSSYRQIVKTFVFKNRRLLDVHGGRVYKKIKINGRFRY